MNRCICVRETALCLLGATCFPSESCHYVHFKEQIVRGHILAHNFKINEKDKIWILSLLWSITLKLKPKHTKTYSTEKSKSFLFYHITAQRHSVSTTRQVPFLFEFTGPYCLDAFLDILLTLFTTTEHNSSFPEPV